MRWPWLLVWNLLLQCHAWVPRATSSAAKIRQGMERARIDHNHQVSKEAKHSKAEFSSRILRAGLQSENRIDRGSLRPDDQVVELYTRQASLGPWLFIKEILLNSTIATSCSVADFAMGGMLGEQARSSLDRYLCLELYGTGLGTPPILVEAQAVSKALRNLRPAAIQLAYRLVDHEDDSIYILDRSKAFTLPVHRKFANRLPASLATDWTNELRPFAALQSASPGEQQRTREDIAGFLAKSKDSDAAALLSIVHRVDQWIDSLLNPPTGSSGAWNQVLVFTDGSAHYDGTKICQTAFAGLVALPFHSGKPSQPEKQRDGDGDGEGETCASSPVPGSADQTRSARKAFQVAGEGCPHPSTFQHALCLHIDSVESVVQKLQDVETLAGISALLCAHIVRNRLAWALRTRTHQATTPLSDRLEVVLHTDSKSLLRQYRQLSSAPPNGEGTGRDALSLETALGMALQLDAGGMPAPGHVTLEWCAGHPEKREDRVDRWTLRECGVFLADELCRKPSQIAMARDRQRKLFERHFHFDFTRVHTLRAHDVLRFIALLDSFQ